MLQAIRSPASLRGEGGVLRLGERKLGALSSLRGLRGAPKVPPLCRETSVSLTANVKVLFFYIFFVMNFAVPGNRHKEVKCLES